LPPGDGAEGEADQGQTRLHDEAALVGLLPLDQEGPVLQLEPCRLLGEINLEGRPGERGGDGKREMSNHHGPALILLPLVNPGEKTELRSSPLVQKSGIPYP
jgi:hypothetical protein